MRQEKNMADLIYNGRMNLGLTQSMLSTKLRFHGQFVSNIERGLAPMPHKYYNRISKFLSIPIDNLKKAAIDDFVCQLNDNVKKGNK